MAADSAVTVAARLDRLPPSRIAAADHAHFARRLVRVLRLFFTAYMAPGCSRPASSSRPRRACSICRASRASSPRCSPACSSARSPSAGSPTASAAARSSPSRCCGIRSAPASWRSRTRRRRIDLWRLIASIGLGVELVNVDTYVSELVPKEQRGPAFAFNQFVMFTAVPVVALLAWLLVPRTIFGLDGWRWVVIIGSIGALVIWWIRLGLPESPRWLAQHGRIAEAERIVARAGAPSPRRDRQRAAAAEARRRRSRAQGRRLDARCGARPIAAAPSCW